MHKVLIHPASYDNCREAIDRAFELFPQPIKGKKVVIKPNALRISRADEHVVTHPAVLRAVVDKVEEFAPAEIVVGDNPGLHDYGDNYKTFEKTGLLEAAKGYYHNLGDESRQIDFNKDTLPRVGVSSKILDAEILISIPKFKTHGLTVLTGAIKNSYGILPGAQKAKLHELAGAPGPFHDLVVDTFRLRVPDLFIMDAVIGMEGNGPASPDLREIGVILAADNGVALDGVVARMMGVEPGNLRFLEKARASGLGDYAADKLETIGNLFTIDDFKLPPMAGVGIASTPAIADRMQATIQLRPQADPDLCSSCEACIEQCPVSALYMENDFPSVTEELCITCFCCQEICPEQAITLK
ncbi:MAG: DUF362 domain-containing protein [Desulfofustis sp.]|nr:DUF362 domain-containing protein [Desulfofustis sp.]